MIDRLRQHTFPDDHKDEQSKKKLSNRLKVVLAAAALLASGGVAKTGYDTLMTHERERGVQLIEADIRATSETAFKLLLSDPEQSDEAARCFGDRCGISGSYDTGNSDNVTYSVLFDTKTGELTTYIGGEYLDVREDVRARSSYAVSSAAPVGHKPDGFEIPLDDLQGIASAAVPRDLSLF